MSVLRKVLFFSARFQFLLFGKNDRSVTLVGEKSGAQARDNGFAYFEHRLRNGDKDIHYVFKKSCSDLENLKCYPKNIVKKNSIKHFYLFLRSKYLFLNDGYADVCPDLRDILRFSSTPFIYLQHGITRYKKIYFNGAHYGGRIIRFMACTEWEKEIFLNKMAPTSVWKTIENAQRVLWRYDPPIAPFSDKRDVASFLAGLNASDLNSEETIAAGQIRQSLRLVGFGEARVPVTGFARHPGLLRKCSEVTRPWRVLIFFTWREYWKKELIEHESPLKAAIQDILSCAEFKAFLRANAYKPCIYLHANMKLSKSEFLELGLGDVEIVNSCDLQKIISESVLLITDYSSVAFEFLISNKAVLYYQFDVDEYREHRGSYVQGDESWYGFIVRDRAGLSRFFQSYGDKDQQERMSSHLRDFNASYAPENSLERLDSAVAAIPKRICFVSYNIYGIGGTVRSVTNLANALNAKGYPVTIISIMRTGDVPAMGLDPSINIVPLYDKRKGVRRSKLNDLLTLIPSLAIPKCDDFYKMMSLYTDIRLISAIRACDADYIVPTFPGACFLAVRLKRSATKCLLQEHKYFEVHPEDSKKRIRKYYPRAESLIVLTEADSRDYQQLGCRNVLALGNGTDACEMGLHARPSGQPKIVLALGRLDPQKQFDLLIEAFSRALNGRSGWELHIYGDGSEKDALVDLVSALGVGSFVKIRRAVRDVFSVIAASEICAVSSQYEGFGMVFTEAYACSKAVITFDIERGPKEIVVDGVTGLKVPPFDVEKYSEMLGRLMDDEALREQLGRNGYKRFHEKYESGAVAERFIDHLRVLELQ